MTESIRELQKRYGSRAMILAIAAGLILILAGRAAWGRGILLGTLFSVINFVLMAEALPKTITAARKRSTLLSFGSVGVRYVLLALPLLIAYKSERFEVFGVCIGLFMVQIVLTGESLLKRIHRP